MKQLRERVHLLTEENQVLFEQITLLRSHYDKFNEDCSNKLSEADQKSQAYDTLHAEYEIILHERDDLYKANSFLEKKLSETSQILGLIEEERKSDQLELKKMREQLLQYQKEYVFYKNLAERLEHKMHEELEAL